MSDAAASRPTPQASPARTVDRTVDLVVFAPLGLALSAREVVPEMARRGRRRLNEQVAMARVIGEFAVSRARREAERLTRRARVQGEQTLAELGLAVEARDPRPSPPPGVHPPGAVPPPGSPSGADSAGPPPPPPPPRPRPPAPPRARPPAPPDTAETGESTAGADLPIPGYDSLSATQVLQRLPGLSAEELAAVYAYELAGRGRRIILNRVAQLQVAP